MGILCWRVVFQWIERRGIGRDRVYGCDWLGATRVIEAVFGGKKVG